MSGFAEFHPSIIEVRSRDPDSWRPLLAAHGHVIKVVADAAPPSAFDLVMKESGVEFPPGFYWNPAWDGINGEPGLWHEATTAATADSDARWSKFYATHRLIWAAVGPHVIQFVSGPNRIWTTQLLATEGTKELIAEEYPEFLSPGIWQADAPVSSNW
ncbi:MAG TPA: hypothetical protein VLG47_03640 [Candidatus Saccharimonadales bacterium]|nr:hypothetical protein [Candidatus Saccharimonadales bacterium]